MIRTLAYIVIILLGLVLSPWILSHTGYLYLSIGDYEVETSVVFAVVALLVIFSAIQLIEWLFVGLINIFVRRGWLSSRWRRQSARKHTLQGALAIAEEDWVNAEKSMCKGASNGELPLVNWLAAARAAHHQGSTEQRDHYLNQAEKLADNKLSIATTRVRYLIQQGELETARVQLDKLIAANSNKPALIKLGLELYHLQQDWSAIKLLLPKVTKLKLLNQSELEELQQQVNRALLKQVEHKPELEKVWHWLSRKERKTSANLAEYAISLARLGDTIEAKKIIYKAIKSHPVNEFFDLLPSIVNAGDDDIRKLLAGLESSQDNNASYHRCLAKLNQQTNNFSEAKHHWQRVIELQPSVSSWTALGKLHEQLGEQAKALNCYRHALQF
ncbi:heme biosynthesis protein HemY [Parashewanella curva]|uniref:Heme biosynthesis protein HemY n=1 Tax=Parashewanella curva TaxID=2338552 RepID=A0A3L8PYB3_9GAMM|nr:heme biosynthesis HemY N-terminal domain-containing protein [Parashewanella curva]RLV60290.1 heme biosynthesis protein HemY [Parashewanella curva]